MVSQLSFIIGGWEILIGVILLLALIAVAGWRNNPRE